MAFWDNYATGQDAANANMLAPIQRQSAMEQLQAQRQSNALNAITLQKQQMSNHDMLGARDAAANAQGTPEQTTTTTIPTDNPVPAAPTSAVQQLNNTIMPSVIQNQSPATQQQFSNMDQLNSNISGNPAMAKLSGADQRLAAMPGPAPDAASPSGFAPQLPADGTGRQVTTTIPAKPVTVADQLTAAKNFWASLGDAGKVDEINKTLQSEAMQQGNMTAAGTSNLSDYYTKIAKMNMTKTQSEMMEKNIETVTKVMKEGGVSALIAMAPQLQQLPGLEKFDPSKMSFDPTKRFISVDAGNGMSVIVDSEHPSEFKVQSMTDIALFAKGYEQKHPNANYADISDAYHQEKIAEFAAKREIARTTIINNPLPAKMSVGMNQLTPEQSEAITKSIGAGLLDPYKVNSKNQQVLADAALHNPGINLNSLSAQLGVARNKDVVMKAGTAEMLPGLVQKTVEAGKALDYSDAKFIGSVERWKQGQLNDPKLTKYMTLRNDQLLTIGGVMRSNGMTDMAQRLEEEAMHPTLAPKALDQWAEGQLESIDPRLNFYRQITKGNAGIPRSPYVTGTGVKGLEKLTAQPQIAPAGTRATANGKVITSDGKGGWN